MNKPESEWIDLPELQSIVPEVNDAERVQTVLTELEERIATADDVSLESYQWMQNAISSISGITVADKVSLESIQTLESKRTTLAESIRKQNKALTEMVNISLEGYAEDFRKDFDELVNKYERSYNKLETSSDNLDVESTTTVTVHHAKLWEMFHVRGKFVGEHPVTIFRKEVENIERVVQILERGVKRITDDVKKFKETGILDRKAQDLPSQNRTYFMFNRVLEVKDGELDFEKIKVKAPAKTYTTGQWIWRVISSVLFSTYGDTFFKLLVDKKDHASKINNSLTNIRKAILIILDLETAVKDIVNVVDQLEKNYQEIDSEDHLNLNRRTVVVMELAYGMLSHIIELTHGTDRLFAKLTKKEINNYSPTKW